MAAAPATSTLTRWTTWAPVIGAVALAGTWGRVIPLVLVVVIAVLLSAAVLSAVHHAEVVAHKVGEPYGSLLLAVAVTVIEVALIVTLMISGGEKTATLARDTVFSAVMITCNGIVGASLLVGSIKFRTTRFNPEGTGAALACVATSPPCAWCCRPSPRRWRVRSSPGRSWPSPRWPRWSSTACS